MKAGITEKLNHTVAGFGLLKFSPPTGTYTRERKDDRKLDS